MEYERTKMITGKIKEGREWEGDGGGGGGRRRRRNGRWDAIWVKEEKCNEESFDSREWDDENFLPFGLFFYRQKILRKERNKKK